MEEARQKGWVTRIASSKGAKGREGRWASFPSLPFHLERRFKRRRWDCPGLEAQDCSERGRWPT